MTEDDFWKLIDCIDLAALDQGHEEAAIDPLREALADCPDERLFGFEEQLSLQLHAIDSRVHADHAGESGESDDGFLYARCHVVAKGRAFYEAVRSDPTRMPTTADRWCEPLLYPHREAWAEQHGVDEYEWPYCASVNYETGRNEALWPE